jgi:hypothetical protein
MERLTEAILEKTNVLPEGMPISAKMLLHREFSAGVRRSEAVSLGHPVIPVLDGFVG